MSPQLLKQYNADYFGTEDGIFADQPTGKSHPPSLHMLFTSPSALSFSPTKPTGPIPAWKSDLPTARALRRIGFGKTSKLHSFTQEGSFHTSLFFLYKSAFLCTKDISALASTNPLFDHLYSTILRLATYDFTWLRNTNPNWETQTHIDPVKKMAFLACLMHYNMDGASVMRFEGHNYTAAHRNVPLMITKLKPLLDADLLSRFERVMTIGSPTKFVAHSTRENFLTYYNAGNHPSIRQKLPQVLKTMNKEEKNNFVMPLPGWITKFTPHIFVTPQHILEKEGRKDRQIFDASN